MRPLQPLIDELRRLDLDDWLDEPLARRFPHLCKLLGGRRSPLPDGDPTLGEAFAADWGADQVARYDVAGILDEVSRAARRFAGIRDAGLPALGSPEWGPWLAKRRLTWFGAQHPARYVSDYAGQETDVLRTLTEGLRSSATRRATNRERLLERIFPDLMACLAARPQAYAGTNRWAQNVAGTIVDIAADVVPAVRVVPSTERRMLKVELPGRDCSGEIARPTVWLDDGGAVIRVDACRHEHPCRWTLSALQGAARWLDTPEGAIFARDSVQPEWQRALLALGRATGKGCTVHLQLGARLTVELRDPAGNVVDGNATWGTDALVPIDREVAEANHQFGLVRLLGALCRHPRVRMGERPIRVVERALSVRLERDGDTVRIRFATDGWTGDAADLAALRRLGSVAFLPSDPGILAFARTDPIPAELVPWAGTAFPAAAIPELLATLDRLGVPVVRAPNLLGDVRPWKPQIAVDLSFEPGAGLAGQVRVIVWDGVRVVAGEGPTRWIGADAEHERDVVGEKIAVEELFDALELQRTDDEPDAFVAPSLEEAVALTRRLEDRQDLVVTWRKPMTIQTVQASHVHFSTRVTGAWFTIGGEIEGADLPLRDLLAAIRDRRRLIVVAADRVIELATPLFEELGTLAALVDVHRDRMRIGRVHEPLLSLITGDPTALSGDVADVDAPATLHAELRPYQLDGLRWLARRAAQGPGAVLADDMGLGKTVQAIGLLCLRAGPALVVAPTSVVPNWIAELGRFAPHLRLVDHRGADRGKDALPPGDVVLTTWDILVRDQALLAQTAWQTAIFDEAHAMKNPKTRRAHAAAGLDVAFRLALTGTPVENRLGELWSLLSVVVPGLLPREEVFRARFQLPIERDGDPARLARLREIVLPFLLRRTKAEVAPFLPPRTERVERVELPAVERRAYDRLRLAAVRDLAEGEGSEARIRVLAAITRLRQAACDARLVEPARESVGPKVQRLVELATALADAREQVLVFSEFTSLLDLCEPALTEAGVAFLRLDGSTPSAERTRRVAAFQAGEAPVFLISRKAGGTGLNLTAATTVIHLDPWWNPAVEDQATDRAHRIGQDRPVTVIRLVSAGTLEEQVLELHAQKRALVAGVLEGASGGALDPRELMALLAEEHGVSVTSKEPAALGLWRARKPVVSALD